MIYKEKITLNGREYIKTYSGGFYIVRDGVEYSAAIDPVDSGREYTESSTPLEDEDASEEDYLAALAELGVSE